MRQHDALGAGSAARYERGSVIEFEKEWEEAVRRQGGRWLIYPEARPRNQWAMFEHVKIEQIQALLAQHHTGQGRVLEYGCGAAGVSIFLANQGFQTTALDVSRNALTVARINAGRHTSARAIDTTHLVQGDTFRLPFKDESFDIVMSYGLLEHFDRDWLEVAIAEVLRTLKPGGLFLADIVPGKPSVRTLGIAVSFATSFLYLLLSLRWSRLSSLYHRYFHEHYENDLDHGDYLRILKAHGLRSTRVQVCRPFPPLALPRGIDALYTRMMRLLLPFWRWFDKTDHWLIDRVGWMYLVSGRK